MIRYDITEDELCRRIATLNATWLTRARARSAELVRSGVWDGRKSPSWSDIKQVYMELQHNKCAYCEQKLENERIEHDVEHYRPKARVDAWTSTTHPWIATGSGDPHGYPELAFHPLNYATVCKTCNTIYKGNFFPVEEPRKCHAGSEPGNHWGEDPLLLYPIGRLHLDPETVLAFRGPLAVPKPGITGYKERTALITIELLGLNREGLLRQRTKQLILLAHALRLLESPSTDKQRLGQRFFMALNSGQLSHTSCVRCFYALHLNDPAQAQELLDESTQLHLSESP